MGEQSAGPLGDQEPTAYRGNDRRLVNDLRGSYYGGPDRRVVSPYRAMSLSSQVMLWVAAVAVLILVVAHAMNGSVSLESSTYVDLRNVSSVLLVLAGALLLVTWAMAGGARHALDGVALLLLGGGTLVLAGPWGSWLHPAGPLTMPSPGACIALSVPALVLLVRSTTIRQIESTVRPTSVAGWTATGVAALLVVEALLRDLTSFQQARLWRALLTVTALGWVVAGGRRLVPAPGERTPARTTAMAWSLFGLGAADVVLAVGLDHSPRWGLVAAALTAASAAATARVALLWLVRAIGEDSERRLRLAGEVADLSIVLADETRIRQRMVRDASTLMRVVRHGGGTVSSPTATKNDNPVVVLPPDPPKTVDLSTPAPDNIATAYADPPVKTTKSWRL